MTPNKGILSKIRRKYMVNYIPIDENRNIFAPFTSIFRSLCDECGMPRYLEEWSVSDGKIWKTESCYHNDEEEIVFSGDPEKVKVAQALQTIFNYINKNKKC